MQDLRTFAPSDPLKFAVFVQAVVGPACVAGEESFDLTVCTPEWLRDQVNLGGPLLGRHFLIVPEYRYDDLEAFVRKFCEGCEGDSWEEVGTKLGRLGRWEFEDYRD